MQKRSFLLPYTSAMLLFIFILTTACTEGETRSPTITTTQGTRVQSSTPNIFVPTGTSDLADVSILLPESPDEIRKLMESSTLCQFPCFLGINPGTTNYGAAIKELSQVATTIIGESKSLDGKFGYNFKIYYPSYDIDVSMDISTLDEIIVSDLTLYPKSTLAKIYSVPQVINEYKAPENIFVFTLSEPYGDGVLPFDLILDYSSKGFLLWYRNPYAQMKNGQIELCYQPSIAPTIFLWASNENRTFLDISPIGKFESKDVKRLEDTMKTGSENLYDLLTLSDGFCVHTEKNDWKDITHYP